MLPTVRRLGLRAVVVLALAAVVGVWAATGGTYGGLSARVTNSVGTTGTATLLYTHTYGGGTTCSSVPGSTIPSTSSFACTGSIAPTAATPASGAATATDSIAVKGSAAAASVTQQVSVASCAPVQLDNNLRATNPMLTRYGTTFAPSPAGPPMTGAGAITLDGANPGGYEAAVTAQAQPNPFLSLGNTYALGIWFKTSSTSGGPLFGLSTDPANNSGTVDRILYMNASGTLAFIQNTSGNTTTTSSTFNNGQWHFAYVTMTALNVALVGVVSTTTIYVDGTSVASGGGLLVGYSAITGYWHVGWSPVSGLPSYFTGSLSNFVVFDTSPAPAAPNSTQRASQTAFDTWASSATEQWRLNDAGTTQFTGTYPASNVNPCGSVAIGWSFASPASCAWSTSSTSAVCASPPTTSITTAHGSTPTITSAAAGATVTSTVSIARAPVTAPPSRRGCTCTHRSPSRRRRAPGRTRSPGPPPRRCSSHEHRRRARAAHGARTTASLVLAVVVLGCIGVAAWWVLSGGRWYIVRTPSMGTAAPVGTLLWVEPTAAKDLHVGDVVTFRPPGLGSTYSHRIYSITADGALHTKGDANAGPDTWTLRPSDVVGRVAARWWGIGWLIRATPVLAIGGLLLYALVRWATPARLRVSAAVVGVSFLLRWRCSSTGRSSRGQDRRAPDEPGRAGHLHLDRSAAPASARRRRQLGAPAGG